MVSNAVLISSSTASTPFLWCGDSHSECVPTLSQYWDVACMHFRKYPTHCCCLGAGKVGLLRGVPETLTQMTSLIFAGSYSSSLD